MFTLYTIYKGVRSRPVTEAITTYPLKVNALYPVVGQGYVLLYWDIENYADSDCRFRLSYNAERVATVSVELKGASRHRFGPLMSDVYYTFTITVIMGTGKAAAESESEMITVYVPREGRSLPSLKRQGSRELTVKFENDQQMFSPLNGAIEDVAVIVSDDIDMNDDNYELKSWFDVKDEETWGSYRATPSGWNPFKKSSKEASFTIGSDDCVRRSLDDPYCNGILRANVPYKVKVRAYMDTKVAMESEWITADGDADEEEEEDKNVAVFMSSRYPLYGVNDDALWARGSAIPEPTRGTSIPPLHQTMAYSTYPGATTHTTVVHSSAKPVADADIYR
ncbi:unnamed protein product [Haemonchus placei]|uniref:PTPRJ transmembrane domain-containing protein n=1 Tax=Haemonchus placei TaxID=6290 RepID=A0A3P7YFL1_HAEPC|nr:unnamed protein product [Haemonchus placei]